MITKPTVLILGAGASKHLGYPVGVELISGICRDEARWKTAEHFELAEIAKFCLELGWAGYSSIDAFLERNPEQMRLGKFLIAECIKACENERALFPTAAAGWYYHLFSRLVTDSPEDLSHNRLTIVTFNYDRSLETYLYRAFSHRFRLSDEDAARALGLVEIIHPHGTFGLSPDVPYTSNVEGEYLPRLADSIQVISEVQDEPDGFASPEFERAHELLVRAEVIYFLGFGFHDDNLRRLKFFSPEAVQDRHVLSTNQGFARIAEELLLQRLAGYGLTKQAFPGVNCAIPEFLDYYAKFE